MSPDLVRPLTRIRLRSLMVTRATAGLAPQALEGSKEGGADRHIRLAWKA